MPSDYEQIRKDNIFEYGNATHHLELLSAHYTNRTHFIFELLQNAEDAKASRILFTLYDDKLEVTHDGRIFNEQDVKGICGVGEGTKADDLTQIGKFGIGFKSVYVYTSAPEIFSGDEHFRIEHYVRPYEVEPKEIEEPWTTRFVLPFDREDFNSEIAFQEIGERLRNLNSVAILFLRNIKEIEFRLLGAYGFYRRHDINAEEHMRQVSIGAERENWLIFERPIPVPDSNHQVRVEVAFKLETDLVGNIDKIRKIHESPLFVYFPTERNTRLGFLIQGPYRTTLGRDNIPSDDTWNKQLIAETATLVVESMHRLKELDLLTVSLLETLPIRVEDFVQGGLFHPIFSRARDAFINEELLPANDGTFVSAKNAKLARGNPTRNLLNHQQLGNLFESTNEIKWLSGEITHNLTPELYSFLMKLDVDEVRPRLFLSKLSERFLQQQSDEWFISFYKFLSTHFRELRDDLPTKPILRLQDRTHVNPSPEGARPNAYLPIGMGNDTVLPIIKERLIKDEEVREFLRNGLKVPEWDIVEEVIKYILPKYKHEFPMVPIEDHKKHFAKIERAYKTDSYEKKSRLQDKLRGTRFIHAEKAVAGGGPRYLKPEQLYFGSDELRLYFDGNDSCNFVNLDEYPHPPSASELLKSLGVKACVRVNKEKPNYEGHVIISDSHGWHKRGLNGFDPNIKVDGLEHAINHPTRKKSAFIWNVIARRNIDFIRGTIETATRQNYDNRTASQETSAFGELLINSAWLPDDSTEQMHRPCELTIDDLPPSFEQDAKLAEQLGMKRDEESELAEKVGIPIEMIEVLKGARPEVLKRPGMLEKFKELLGGEDSVEGDTTTLGSSNSEFPESLVRDPERRAAKFGEELKDSPKIEFEERARSVRVNPPIEVARERLKSEYTNDDGQMICQICQKTMPFKKPDGEYYFEAVEAITKEHYDTEHEAKFLALCPVCAARYQVFIKGDKDAMQAMIDGLMAATDFQVQLRLGELNASLRFVEKHWRDIKQILESI